MLHWVSSVIAEGGGDGAGTANVIAVALPDDDSMDNR
jgi:hypothetical protein